MSDSTNQTVIPSDELHGNQPASVDIGKEKKTNIMRRFLQQDASKASKWISGKSYRVRNRSEGIIKLTSKADSQKNISIINANTARVLQGEALDEIDQKLLDNLEGEGHINIRELAYIPTQAYTINNLTAQRISIKHNAFNDRNLFVPGFGSRTVNGKTLLDLDYLGWESQGLIEINPVKTVEENVGAYTFLGLTIIFLGLFLVVSILLIIFGNNAITWGTVGIGTLIGLALIGISLFFANSKTGDTFTNLGSWLGLLPGILLVLATGIGLPLATIYFYGDGQKLLQTNSTGLDTLGRILQAGFISVASMLPAFLFYLFGRQQVEKQKENFYREAMLLDPNVWSRSEAENKYNPLLNSVFDSGNSPFSVLLLVISTAILVMSWVITLSPIGPSPTDIPSLIIFFTPDKSPFTLGFLGVYFFTINMIYRRYVRADLTPKTYAYITMRLLITFVLVWAISTLPQFSKGSALETGLSAIAFVIGIFPESGLTLIQEYVSKITSKRIGQDQDLFSLTKLEGMNLYDQARLMEEGIENIENLAHHNLMELIVRTRIPTPRIIDMFDQAILYLHLGPEEDTNNLRIELKSLGIRTATDLIFCRNEIDAFLKDDSTRPGLVNKLNIITASLKDDEWFNYIKSWRENLSLMAMPINDPYKFYYRVTRTENSVIKDINDQEPPSQVSS